MTKHTAVHRITAFATVLQLVSCGGKPPAVAPPAGKHDASPLSDRVLVQAKDLPDGLDMHVSEGKQGPPAYDRGKIAAAAKLPDAEAQALLARAPAITKDPDDKQAFALRPDSTPPPRTGRVIKDQFPGKPSIAPPPASTAPHGLHVLRYMPEGKVPLAPELSVTFDAPMVAVTSQDDAAGVQPVALSPTPPGHWRWIGTRTLLFDPVVRFPQATTYTVSVPAGTRSATGETLAAGDAKTFTFETPTPSIVQTYPPSSAPQRLDVPMLIELDQKIDPAKVFAKVEINVDGKVVPAHLLADRAAIEATHDKQLLALVDSLHKQEQDGRWIAVAADKPFPKDASVSMILDTGTPSAEGPNLTPSPMAFAFRTFPPLKVDRIECGWGNQCRPGMPLQVVFNNPLDVDRFAPTTIGMAPDIAGAKIVQSGQVISVIGATKARMHYTLTMPASLLDAFGQTLGTDQKEEFDVGDAQPTFFGPSGLVVADPAAKKPSLDFFTTNYEQLKVRLYKVTPADYEAYTYWERNRWNHDHPPAIPGTKVFDQLVATPRTQNELVETSVDLAPALTNGLGHAIAFVEPYPWTEKYEPPTLVAWVQTTKLGVDAHVDDTDLLAMVTDLGTGKPAAGVALEIAPFGIKSASDDKGMATLKLGHGGTKGQHLLLARRGADVAFVTDNQSYNEYGSWVAQDRGKTMAWYVIDDRKLYKPGEEVSLKGWLREIDNTKGGDVDALASGEVASVTYTVFDAQRVQLASGAAPVDAVGGFDAKFSIPKTPNLGYAYVQFETTGRMAGQKYNHGFRIEEFRRPEFEVKASASQGPFVVGETAGADITVNAKYYAGGPLAGAQTTWYVTASQTNFTPPNRDDYTFGSWTPWWGYSRWSDDEGGRGYQPPKTWQLQGPNIKTDATGAHVMHLDFLSVKPAMPMSVVANATVMDVNRQAWSAAQAVIVHPSMAYVGLKVQKMFVEKDEPFDLDVVGVDLDGKALVGTPVEVRSVRLDWEYKTGKYTEVERDPQTCAVTAAADAVKCEFASKAGGEYKVTATIADAKGRANQTTLTYWVAGGDQPPEREVKQQQVQLIPDHKDYAPGDTAQLMMQAPFYPAEALVTWRRSGIVKTERFSVDGPTRVLSVPIVDGMTPGLTVQVDLVGAAGRTDDKGIVDPKLPKRPAYAVGSIALAIPPKHRGLAVKVSPAAAKIAPGEATKLTLEVRDAKGNPVANADAAVIVVDEAILGLAGYDFPNPLDFFYGGRGPGVRDYYERAYVKLAKPDAGSLVVTANLQPTTTTGDMDGFGGMVAGSPARYELDAVAPAEAPPPPPPPPGYRPAKEEMADARKQVAQQVNGSPAQQPGQAIAIRANFNPLAAFAPAVKTDAQGRATVDVRVPDNLTRYRIVAVVASTNGKQYGKGESAVTARLPLMVRPSPPRFLNFGDTFRLPVVVQNQTDAPMHVKLAVRATNAAITDGAGRTVDVPANERVEVQFPAAAEMAGTARFQIVGTDGRANDAAEVALPVWTPATTEAFATYGVIDSGVEKQPIALPGDVVKQFGGLSITTASTNLQALTDAMLYLVHYPFECAEQRSSRILAIAALKDVLTAFKTKDMPSPSAMEASVKDDIEHLSQMQNYDGGFAYWDRGYPSEPYLSVYVANALGHAKDKGFAVAPNILNRALQYLGAIENHYPAFYPREVRWAISAYALYTRKQLGALDIAKAKKLVAEIDAAANGNGAAQNKGQGSGMDKATMETWGWLLGTLAGDKAAATERASIVRHATNKVSETAGAATFTVGYGDGAYLLLASDRRVDAVMLDSLIAEAPHDDLIPKIVTGLLAHRKAGRWLNTQENTFALLALDRYFQTYEKVTPDFVARVWLGNDYAGDHAFKGYSTDYYQVDVPMADVVTHDKTALTLQKDGKGRLYYRIGMTYAPASLKLEPADYGFVVQRRYEGVDDPHDVTHAADGTWHVKAGARVRVQLTMVNENRRYHVALVDPMPAGFESLNPALATTGPIPQDPTEQKQRGAYWWWYGPWYEHQNLRDERTEAFAQLLWAGVHEYSYVARATTPGNFVVPPSKAEEMYMPETFGRSGSDRVVVE